MTNSGGRPAGRLRSAIAVLVARVAIPLWLGAGAVLKLVDGSPSNLPAALVKWLGGIGVDLRFVLELSIAAELVVAGVMVLVPGLARPVGIAMLAAFVPVLIGDLALGASSCGCFGAVQVPPWVTLATDVAFLVCLVVVARGVAALRVPPSLPTRHVVAAGLWSAVSIAVAFFPAQAASPAPAAERRATEQPAAPAEGYFLPVYDEWIGRRFDELDIAGWIRGLPEDIGTGQQLVLFYRLDCEHCHELMEVYFAGEPPAPTTAVAVPERAGFPTEGLQPFVCGACRLAELPSGVDWFLQTPVLVSLADGVVACAAEVTAADPACLEGF